MKKILLIILLFASCKKDVSTEHNCKQCIQIVTDSLTNDTLEIKYGTPDKSSMYYCDEVLKTVQSQKPAYFHNKVIKGTDTSLCQKYEYKCN